MAYSNTLHLVAGDTLPELKITLKDSHSPVEGSVLDPDNSATWGAIDISGASVKLRLREIGATEVIGVLACVATEPQKGKCVTNFPVGTLSKAGTLEGEIEITFANGGVQTVFELIKIKVRGQVG